ncbi:MAG: type IV pilus twitching motility protein PilT [Verrucomicrobiota bacterium]
MDLQSLLEYAVAAGASDVHLKIGQPPVMRHDGALRPVEGWQPLGMTELEEVLAIVSARDAARLSSFEQTGELDVAYTPPGLPRLRVNAFRQRGAISLALRVIPSHVPTFAELQLPEGIEVLAEQPRGLVLCTGATGSGKSTTLAAMIGHINATRSCHIVTIEDPIEFLHDDRHSIVNQREVGLDTASFSEALRRALRQDPDVILIGEMRDAETAQTAIQAAESGHLVLSTLHTVDAAETIGRIVEFFPHEKHQQVRSILSGVLRGVISQRLLPRIDGGRIAAVEVMITNARIADLIRENRVGEIEDAVADGAYFRMQTFTQALIGLVLGGVVDTETAAAAAGNRHDFLVALDKAVKERAEAERKAAEEEPEAAEPAALRLIRPAGR